MKKYNIKNLILKYKKVVAIVGIIFILGSGFMLIKLKNNNDLQRNSVDMADRTVKLQKGELNNSIIVSGKVKSGEVSNVSSSIPAKVKSINVKVGDTVKVGDVICILDDSDIVKQIESKTKSIEEERKSLQDNYNKISEQIENLKNVQDESLKSQNKLIEVAKNNLDNANMDLNNYEVIFNNIKNTYNIMLDGIRDKQNNYDNAENNKNICYENWIKSGGSVDSNEYQKYIEASKFLNEKQLDLDNAKSLYNYDDISSKYNESLAIYNDKLSARNTANAQYEEAVSNSKNITNSNSLEISNLQSSMNDVSKQIEKLNDNSEIKELKENLNKTVLKAETSGKITDLKVNVGSVAEGVIATIQSTDNLILGVNIPEYDIKKVSTGMKVKISSDSLSNKVNGELIGISPVASNDEKGGFSAEVAIEKGSGLFIGTNAKAEIIISGKNNVIIAPIDSIKNINNNPSILVKDGDKSFKEVSVTLGDKNDYYVEVSGEGIKEGLEIKADISLDNSDNINKEEGEGVNE